MGSRVLSRSFQLEKPDEGDGDHEGRESRELGSDESMDVDGETPHAHLACCTPKLVAEPFDVESSSTIRNDDRVFAQRASDGGKIGSSRGLLGALRCVCRARCMYVVIRDNDYPVGCQA